jgi:CRP-like cAMP-binding protein
MAKATEGVAGLRATPPTRVLTHGFVDQGIRYELRFYIDHFTDRSTIEATVRDRIWYLLQRNDLPFATAPRGASLQLSGAEAPDQNTRAQAIRKIDFLQGASDAAIATLAAGSHIELYAPGELVVRQGETGEELYLCLSGELKVLHQPEAGPEREIARLQQGGLFGEIAQLTGQVRNASVRAVSACELIVVHKQAFVQVLQANPALAESMSERLAQRRAELEAAGRSAAENKADTVAKHKTQLLSRIREFFLSS